MEKLNTGWVLSLDRLIELTARDPKRVVRPVSPQMVIRQPLLPPKQLGKRTRPARRR